MRPILLLTLLLLIGCGKPAATPVGRTVTDEVGQSVTIPTAPQRIVSLAPSVTEMLFSLGLGDRLVGVTTYCDFPEAAQSIPKVGSLQGFSLETVVGMKPDLVIATTEGNSAAEIARLRDLGLSVYTTAPRTFAGILTSLDHLGAALGVEARAKVLTDSLRRRIATVTASRDTTARRPRLLIVVSHDPLYAATVGTFPADIAQLAGARVVPERSPVTYPQLDREGVIAIRPEVLLVPVGSTNPLDQRTRASLLGLGSGLPTRLQLVTVPADPLLRPGPRAVAALETLAAALDSLRRSP